MRAEHESALSGGSRNKIRSRGIREACFLVFARVQPPGSSRDRLLRHEGPYEICNYCGGAVDHAQRSRN